MSPEKNPLTRDIVAQAESRIGVIHPVISVIDNNLDKIEPLNDLYKDIVGGNKQQEFIREHYGFLADALVEASPFTLEPTDLISIWSRAQEVFSTLNQRYSLATMISSAYAIQGLDENPAWKKLPRRLLETGELPNEALHDSPSLLHIRRKAEEIRKSLDELDFYTYGTREDAIGLAFQLGMRVKKGDISAIEESDRLLAHHKTHSTPTLGALHENFQNSWNWLSEVEEALDGLGIVE